MTNLHALGEVDAPFRLLFDRLAEDLIGPAPLTGPLTDIPSEGILGPAQRSIQPVYKRIELFFGASDPPCVQDWSQRDVRLFLHQYDSLRRSEGSDDRLNV